MNLEDTYRQRHDRFLKPIAQAVETYLIDILASTPRIDRVSARAKSVERFLQKAAKTQNGKPKYSDPLNEIYDQIGARIVTFYPSDVITIADNIMRYLRPVENIIHAPSNESEFGYTGQHFILLLPSDVLAERDGDSDSVQFFELQITTLFQHAWAEAEHDLGYKPTGTLTSLQKRKMAFTAAQAWGADQMFDELFKELHAVQTKSSDG